MERIEKKKDNQKQIGSPEACPVQMTQAVGNQSVLSMQTVIQMATLNGFPEEKGGEITSAINSAIELLDIAIPSLLRYKANHRRADTGKIEEYINKTKSVLTKADLEINITDIQGSYGYSEGGKMYLNIENGINIKTIIHEAFHIAGYNLNGNESSCECDGPEALGRLLDGNNPNADTFAQFVLRSCEVK